MVVTYLQDSGVKIRGAGCLGCWDVRTLAAVTRRPAEGACVTFSPQLYPVPSPGKAWLALFPSTHVVPPLPLGRAVTAPLR